MSEAARIDLVDRAPLTEKPAQNPMNLISAQQTCMKQMNRLKPRS